MRTERRIERVKYVLSHRQDDLTVVVENIHDPHNVSAIIRTCDAVGVFMINLVYTIEQFPDIGKKSSAGAMKWVYRRNFKSVDECYNTLRDEGFKIYATKIVEGAKSLYELDLTQKIAFVFGNEHRGVSDEASEKADGIFMIPMFGMVQSLNVSVACAVTLYEALRQRLLAGHYDKQKLNPEIFEKVFLEWIEK
ncbi:TrmH family RNA methyltransferase [Candidatus Kryptobacter tengchongensis]|uniref:tRNA (guanosine(18)-2'-O)-methyltransferase n=1 Tax=Kryptobacter tengchongensis TaxID=1643429 RepID=A0A656D8D8_KRYT1|nr:RNA methyltransferase [Candidatus Kryptobacter tengchongensis]CUT01123.1 tRNA (guanosine-2'-O-)-methyltransferase [Candidatus Kryptobacter tengchongensis]